MTIHRMTINSGEFRLTPAWPVAPAVRDLAELGWLGRGDGSEWPPVNAAFENLWLFDAWRITTDPETVAALSYRTITGLNWDTATTETQQSWQTAEQVQRALIVRLPHWRTALEIERAA